MSVFSDVSGDGTPNKPAHGNTRNWAHYQKLRKENPRQYYGSRTQRQMLEDRERLGKEAFYSKNGGSDE